MLGVIGEAFVRSTETYIAGDGSRKPWFWSLWLFFSSFDILSQVLMKQHDGIGAARNEKSILGQALDMWVPR